MLYYKNKKRIDNSKIVLRSLRDSNYINGSIIHSLNIFNLYYIYYFGYLKLFNFENCGFLFYENIANYDNYMILPAIVSYNIYNYLKNIHNIKNSYTIIISLLALSNCPIIVNLLLLIKIFIFKIK